MAVGATAGAIARLVVGQSVRLAGMGAAVGLLVAFAALRTLNSLIQLAQVTVLDVRAFGVAVFLIVVVAAVAAYAPARRAARIDPAATLRADG
jgi:ABC-type antimicrobial peptide transport system permease subunit